MILPCLPIRQRLATDAHCRGLREEALGPRRGRQRQGGFLRRTGRMLAVMAVALGLLAGSVEAGGRTLFFPHLISGMGFETRLVFDNPSN